MSWQTIALGLAFFSQYHLAMGEEAKTIDPKVAVGKIRDAKIINPKCSLNVNVTGKEEATVEIQRDLKASDDDCKIDAILVSRTLMDTYPKQLMRVKSVFALDNGDRSQATVTAGDIRAFKSGQLDKKALLDSIELVKVSPLTAQVSLPEVAPGLFQDWRQRTLLHINQLGAEKVNVKPFLDEYNDIEKMVGTHQPKVMAKRLAHLTVELSEQDQMKTTNQANQANLATQANQPGRQPFFKVFRFGGRRKPVEVSAAVKERLQELAGQGQDITPYTQKIEEISRLSAAGRDQEARRLVNELSQTLGM